MKYSDWGWRQRCNPKIRYIRPKHNYVISQKRAKLLAMLFTIHNTMKCYFRECLDISKSLSFSKRGAEEFSPCSMWSFCFGRMRTFKFERYRLSYCKPILRNTAPPSIAFFHASITNVIIHQTYQKALRI